MNLKNSLLATAFVSLVFLLACTNETEDNLATFDCATSDLAVELNTATTASCSTGGSITVAGSGGQGSIVYIIDGNNFNSSATFDDLSAGSYTITARDENGCTTTTTVTVEAEANTVSFEVEVVQSSCDNDTGSITVSASGGSGNYEYSIDGSTFVIDPEFANLAPGEYTVSVKSGECLADRSVKVLSGVTLSGDIMPIVDTNCAITGCHKDAVSPRLTTAEAIMSSAIRIGARTSARTMPPSGRPDLTDDEINKIACWLADGAPGN